MARKIAPRSKDFPRWYTDIIAEAQLADYSPVKGCMVIRPYGYAIWERIQSILDRRIKQSGHENAYFPLFIPEEFLQREKEHVEGFSPELAVVTYAGGKPLEERLVVRPTSETIMYSMYSKWVQSYRDLPLLINQWANVVRWEMRTRLFLRTTEFLWQEGHTVHATHEDAETETLSILDMYRTFMEDTLAISPVTGLKTNAQKFAGALKTYTVEGLMGDGKALQLGTSHDLGQNFSKVFNIQFTDQDGELKYAWQTSWGVSTRLIGGLVMTHGDDYGLILPPRVAPIQVVIIPIWKGAEEKEALLTYIPTLQELCDRLDIRHKVDDRESLTPGFKFNHWEQKGVPLRIEIGPRDLAADQMVLARRDIKEKRTISAAAAAETLPALLDEIQAALLERSRQERESCTRRAEDFTGFTSLLEEKGGLIKAHWCGEADCEAQIQTQTKATIRCLPLKPDRSGVQEAAQMPCVHCGKPATLEVLFARSY